MGYRVLSPIEQKYQPRKGLEGPFNFSGRVLYYDAKEGKYYDPTTDFYVDDEEMTVVHQRLVDCLVR
jgi:hypothetical protein